MKRSNDLSLMFNQRVDAALCIFTSSMIEAQGNALESMESQSNIDPLDIDLFAAALRDNPKRFGESNYFDGFGALVYNYCEHIYQD